MVLLNVNGFYTPLKQQIDLAVEEGFISKAGQQLVSIVDCDPSNIEACGDAVLASLCDSQRRSLRTDRATGTGTSLKDPSARPRAASSTTPPASLSSSPTERLSPSKSPTSPSPSTRTSHPLSKHCNLHLKRGSRCLLIGANGAGKSTLLRLLAGKKLCDSKVRVFGKDVFRDSPSGVTYLGTEWAMNPVVRSDIVVSTFLDSVGGYRHKARRDRLLDILDVDLTWHMHAISDGERRRVQLCMGLMEPWDLLLLDEVTVDLDVQVRADLLDFLQQETVERGATIIYATHIFDGLQSFLLTWRT